MKEYKETYLGIARDANTFFLQVSDDVNQLDPDLLLCDCKFWLDNNFELDADQVTDFAIENNCWAIELKINSSYSLLEYDKELKDYKVTN